MHLLDKVMVGVVNLSPESCCLRQTKSKSKVTVCAALGMYTSYFIDISSGAMIVLTFALIFSLVGVSWWTWRTR